jgi:hypothetical protein
MRPQRSLFGGGGVQLEIVFLMPSLKEKNGQKSGAFFFSKDLLLFFTQNYFGEIVFLVGILHGFLPKNIVFTHFFFVLPYIWKTIIF